MAWVLLLSGPDLDALAQSAGSNGQAAPPAREQTYAFDIPPQPLSGAVEAFAVATGIQVIYDRPAGGEIRSPGMQGQATAARALAQILTGAGLQAHFTDAHDVLLEPIETQPSAAPALPAELANGPSLSLDTLEVPAPATVEALSKGFDQGFYRSQIANRIHEALARSPATAKGPYEATVQLWISPSGRLNRTVVTRSSGDVERDRAIVQILSDFQLDGPAPPDMPQPVSVGIQVRPAGG